jgi:hypothetical protein
LDRQAIGDMEHTGDCPMRIGMVGLDNSHCTMFAAMLNDPEHPCYMPGAQLVAAYRGGSDRFSLSRSRIDGFTDEVTARYGIPLYDSIEDLADDVDAILLESTDGGQHAGQFRRMAMGKPVYIDKPFATSTADAREMLQLSAVTRTPLMSCSSLRYAAGIWDLHHETGEVVSCQAFGPTPILDDYPALFWYGVHSAEILFSFMGPGCVRVRCITYRDMDVAIGEWEDGRVGLIQGMRSKEGDFGCVVHRQSDTQVGLARDTPSWFCLLLRKVLRFFETGISPIDSRETFEIVSFLEGANWSRERAGVPASVERL